LLEVLDRFPGADDDELLVTEFGPSANLLIVGDLHLALGSPAQVRSATKRRDPVSMAAKGGEVVFDDGSVQAAELKRELGL
jgi:S1-C subfamily serine protease